MSSMQSNIGGARISIEIQPLAKETPINPHIGPDIQAFLSMMEKASQCGKDGGFSRCLASFLEEIDTYLDDGYTLLDEAPMDPEIVEEMEAFMDDRLPEGVKKNLRKLG